MPRIFEYLWNSFGPSRIIEVSDLRAPIIRVGDEGCGRLLQVNPCIGRRHLKYFQFYDAWNDYDAKKIARIDFWTPKYILCKNSMGVCNWFLYHSEKEYLMDILSSKYEDGNFFFGRDVTNWQASILWFNTQKGSNRIDFDETMKNLLSDKFLKYPECLPFDLKMPDYRKLPNN